MVIKPLEFITRSRRSLLRQRSMAPEPEYLRIIYGPDYTLQETSIAFDHGAFGEESTCG